MDETPLLINITNTKTIAKICSKEVDIITHMQKNNVTAIIWIVAGILNCQNLSASTSASW